MQGTVDGFSYGLVTPVAAYLMACLGGALGLRCTTRSLRNRRSFKPGWLALGATAIGSGIWTMHFIAMMGFTVAEAPIGYDRPTTFASLAVAIVMVGIGIFIVGYRGATPMALVTGGTITGLGVASMHYLGMAGMRLQGRLEYDTLTVCPLRGDRRRRRHDRPLGGRVRPRLPGEPGRQPGDGRRGERHALHGHGGGQRPSARRGRLRGPGDSPATLLAPMLVGPVVFLLLAGVVVMFDPLLVMGEPDWRPADGEPRARGCPPSGPGTARAARGLGRRPVPAPGAAARPDRDHRRPMG